MIRNINIHNILDIIEISKSMEPNECIQENIYENVHLNVFYNFSNFNGSKKIKVCILSGTTQGQDCPGINGELPQFTIEICE